VLSISGVLHMYNKSKVLGPSTTSQNRKQLSPLCHLILIQANHVNSPINNNKMLQGGYNLSNNVQVDRSNEDKPYPITKSTRIPKNFKTMGMAPPLKQKNNNIQFASTRVSR
jgi:hypothetical protein